MSFQSLNEEKKVPLFFNVKEQARALASFSQDPHSKKEVEKANKTVHRGRNILEYIQEEVADTEQTVQKLKVWRILYSSNKCTLPLSVYKLKTSLEKKKKIILNTKHISTTWQSSGKVRKFLKYFLVF